MADHTRRGINPVTLLLVAANIIMLAWITISFLGKERSRPSASAYGAGDLVINTNEMVPRLPDIEADPIMDEGSAGADVQASVSYPEVLPDAAHRRPDYSDFEWYFEEVRYDGMWDDAVRITNAGKVLGDWKAYIRYDPLNVTGDPCDMLFNIDISAGQSRMIVLCEWYYMKFDKAKEPVYQDGHSTQYTGNWDGSAIRAEGGGTMDLTGFFERGTKQYAAGEMKDVNGVSAILVMVREKE